MVNEYIKIIEENIDHYHESNTLFSIPIQEFIQLLFSEVELTIAVLREKSNDVDGIAEDAFFGFLTKIISACEQCVEWAFVLCDKSVINFGVFPELTLEYSNQFSTLLHQSEKYSTLTEHFISFYRGKMGAELISNDHIRFFEDENQFKFSNYNHYLRRIEDDNFNKKFIKDIDFSLLQESIKVSRNTKKISNSEIENFYTQTEEEFNIAIKPFIAQANIWWERSNRIPLEWEFDIISNLDFRKFSTALLALLLHTCSLSIQPEATTTLYRRFIPTYTITGEHLVYNINL
ncbi:MAG: hypothetical protein ACYCYM_05570 [Saccharofermentanales bacterium]